MQSRVENGDTVVLKFIKKKLPKALATKMFISSPSSFIIFMIFISSLDRRWLVSASPENGELVSRKIKRGVEAKSVERIFLLFGVNYLQHVEQRRLSGIIKTEEQQLCVLVREAELREEIPDYLDIHDEYVS